ncbi:MAG: hypothetical protein HOJ88_01805 [Proteobacteria bacterium]|jgi:hypothetical protein|nr:hypothetical protein [Pseudomonadota bacterium]
MLKSNRCESVKSCPQVLSLSIAILVILCSACTSRELYTAAQDNQRQSCLRLPPAQQSECMEGLGESYDSYKRQREEVTDK